jgi:hypothetical protein
MVLNQIGGNNFFLGNLNQERKLKCSKQIIGYSLSPAFFPYMGSTNPQKVASKLHWGAFDLVLVSSSTP